MFGYIYYNHDHILKVIINSTFIQNFIKMNKTYHNKSEGKVISTKLNGQKMS